MTRAACLVLVLPAALAARDAAAGEPCPTPPPCECRAPTTTTTPAPAPPEPEPEPARTVAPLPKEPFRLRVGVSGQAAYRRLYQIPVYMAGGAAAIGAERNRAGWALSVRALIGDTDVGLSTSEVALTFWVLARPGPFHVAGGLNAAFFALRRATTGNSFTSSGPGLVVRAGYDLLEHEDTALELFAQFDDEILKGTVVWGPTVGLGLRF